MKHVLGARVRDSADWSSAALNEREWIETWTADERGELDALARAALHRPEHKGGKRDAQLVTSRLRRVAEQLESGPGVALIRGAPVQSWSEDQTKAVTLWLGWNLGVPRGQNADGALITALRDVGADYKQDPEARGYMSNDELQPHTDGCDVTALLCFKSAKQGGATRVASSIAIYNYICQNEPELLATLIRGFPFYVRDADGKGGRLLDAPLPVYFEEKGVVSACFNAKSVEVAAVKRGAELTAIERRALERVRNLAQDPRFCVDITLTPGDLLLFSNWTTFHSRSAFVDEEDPSLRRCLMRLWIQSRIERPLPDWMAKAARRGLGAQNRQGEA